MKMGLVSDERANTAGRRAGKCMNMEPRPATPNTRQEALIQPDERLLEGY
jgi:hypothetical protein